MVRILTGELPNDAFLARYADLGYADCFYTDVDAAVSLQAFLNAFYTTWLFKAERQILRLVGRPSTDSEAMELAEGIRSTYAAWEVEDRAADQILMCDMAERTRSWLHVRPLDGGTRLYFGSAVVPDQKSGKMGRLFHALMGFHTLYSKMLLKATVRKLSAAALGLESAKTGRRL